MRQVLEECHEYECAIQRIEETSLMAGVYFIVVGLKGNEGVIITRDRSDVVDKTTLREDKWFLVQTNQDHFKGDCPIRCQSATHGLEEIGQKNIVSSLNVTANILNKWPNKNLFSIYTSIYVPYQNQLSETYNIYADNLEDPGDII